MAKASVHLYLLVKRDHWGDCSVPSPAGEENIKKNPPPRISPWSELFGRRGDFLGTFYAFSHVLDFFSATGTIFRLTSSFSCLWVWFGGLFVKEKCKKYFKISIFSDPHFRRGGGMRRGQINSFLSPKTIPPSEKPSSFGHLLIHWDWQSKKQDISEKKSTLFPPYGFLSKYFPST